MKKLIKWAFGVVVVLLVAGLIINGTEKAQDTYVQHEMDHVSNQVAEDAVKQYEIAKRSGSAIDAATQAGIVAAAYLQAKDEENYKKWKAVEKEEMKAAGMPDMQ